MKKLDEIKRHDLIHEIGVYTRILRKVNFFGSGPIGIRDLTDAEILAEQEVKAFLNRFPTLKKLLDA